MVITRENRKFWKWTVTRFPSLAGVLNLAFSLGGFCAGGYPRMLYHGHRDADKYLKIKNSRSTCATGGDVDLFFRTQEGFDRFIVGLRSSTKLRSFTIKPSMAKLAMDIEFRGIESLPDKDEFYNVQAIGTFLGSPQEIIEHFDFSNCMIGFEKDVVYEDERFASAEASEMLEIVNWKQGSLMYRVQKYVNIHGYKKMHPNCQKQFVSWMYDTYFKIDEEFKKSENLDGNEGKHQFRARIRSIMGQEGVITDADLLLLCAVFEGDRQYNYTDAFTELRRRGKLVQDPDMYAVLDEQTAEFNVIQ